MAGLCGGYMSVDVRSRLEKLYKTHPPVGLIVNIFISATFASTLTTIGIRAGYLSKLDTHLEKKLDKAMFDTTLLSKKAIYTYRGQPVRNSSKAQGLARSTND